MDFDLPMILPQGIVLNTEEIYKELAALDLIPPAKLHKYWQIYSTTHKYLKDPTASRLEQYWWRVWGSDCKNLKASTLARLYEIISKVPPFVPLRGPPNRWEKPDVPPLITAEMIIQASKIEEVSGSLELLSPPAITVKPLPSSASKPPPSRTILKKPSGPSSKNPPRRAHFDLPLILEVAEEDPSSGSTAVMSPEQNSSIALLPPTKLMASEEPTSAATSPQKKALTLLAKRVRATPIAGRRRQQRPQMTKRRSSQSSCAPSAGSRESISSSSSRSESAQLSGHSAVEHPAPEHPPKTSASQIPLGKSSGQVRPQKPAKQDHPENRSEQGNRIPPSEAVKSQATAQEQPPMSEKARGKQPVRPTLPVSELSRVLKENRDSLFGQLSVPLQYPRPYPPPLSWSHSSVNVHTDPRRKSTFGVHSLIVGNPIVPPNNASYVCQTRDDYIMKPINGRPPVNGLFTKSTSSISDVKAEGTIIDQSGMGGPPPSKIIDPPPPSHFPPPERVPSVLDPRFTVTPPSTSPRIPLGRTKSQLMCVLRRSDAQRVEARGSSA